MNLNKVRSYIKQDALWKIILTSIPKDTILFFDVEVYPPVDENTKLDKVSINAIGVKYGNDTRVFIGEEDKVIEMFNIYLSPDKEIYLTVGYGTYYLDIPLLLLKIRQYPKKYINNIRRVLNKVPHLDLVYPTSTYLYAINKIDKLTLVSLKEASDILGLGKEEFTEYIYYDINKLEEYLKKDIIAINKLFDLLYDEYFMKL